MGGCCQGNEATTKKKMGVHSLTLEESSTILTSAEATLNSHPLTPLDSTLEDGVPVLTAGHFLISRALRAHPSPTRLPI